MLILFTDYGWTDPYVGQMKAVLAQQAPGVPVIDLLHDVPDFNAHAGAHLLAALATSFPPGAVFLCVVDPGVGGPREAVVLQAEGRWFVGPDNGLLSIVAARASLSSRSPGRPRIDLAPPGGGSDVFSEPGAQGTSRLPGRPKIDLAPPGGGSDVFSEPGAHFPRVWHLGWRPDGLSASFHGRDLFAPVAARLASGDFPREWLVPVPGMNVQFDAADLPHILYVDHFGNAWTGLRGGLAGPGVTLEVRGHCLSWRRVFSETGKGEAFWYVNSVGLVEIAANRASAARILGLALGDRVRLSGSPDNRWY